MRYYSSLAGAMVLQNNINSGATLITLDTVTGLPAQTPFILTLDAGLGAAEEVVLVTDVGGLNCTITRAVDGTTAQSHSIGAVVLHTETSSDLQLSRDHEAATVAHGATGAVVGTTNTQTLTNKTISGGSNTLTAIPQSAVTNLVANLATLTAADVSINANIDAVEADVATLETEQGVQDDRLDSIETYLPNVIRKSSNETLTSATLQNDNELTCSLSTGTWEVEFNLRTFGPAGSNFKTNYTFSGTLTSASKVTQGPGTTSTDAYNAQTFSTSAGPWNTETPYGTVGTTTADVIGIQEKLLLVVSAPGTLHLQWAQQTAIGVTTVAGGSWMIYRKLVT